MSFSRGPAEPYRYANEKRFVQDLTDYKRRRFRILDICALTFASALSVVACRELHPGGIFKTHVLVDVLFYVRTTVLTFSVLLAVLVLLDEMPLSQAVRHPGRACLIAVLIAVPFVILVQLRYVDAFRRGSIADGIATMLFFALLQEAHLWAACCTATAWTIVLLRRDNTRTFDWLEIAGIAIGILWILHSIAREFVYHGTEIFGYAGVTMP